jgi:hypothetical protein
MPISELKMLVVGKATGEPERMEMEEIKLNRVASHRGAAQSCEKKSMACSSTGHGVRYQSKLCWDAMKHRNLLKKYKI